MSSVLRNSRFLLTVMLLIVMLSACSKGETYTESNFVGKWQSSRVTTELLLNADGEWQFLTDDGAVQQYGIWQYSDNKIMWTVRVNDKIVHDLNTVLSVTPEEFKLREKDGSITTFRRLE